MYDQLNRKISFKNTPHRIVSVVPSQTEFLYDIGLVDSVVGITKFCPKPQNSTTLPPIIGGTKTLRLDKIKNLHPDLIIANKEENDQAQIEELAKNYNVWVSDIKNLKDAIEMMQSLGEITQKNEKTTQIISKIRSDFQDLQVFESKKVVYMIWQNPLMVAGGDTYINEMLRWGGFENIFKEKNRYPTTTIQEITDLRPDYLFLSSEPFPFKEKHITEFEKKFPHTTPILVDGTMFSWYGSRLQLYKNYVFQLRKKLENN